MSTEQNKANDRRVIEGLNQGSVAVFEEVAVPNYVGHESSTTMQGREAYNMQACTPLHGQVVAAQAIKRKRRQRPVRAAETSY